MYIVAYQTDKNNEPTGLERLLDSLSIRHAAAYLAFVLNGKLSLTRKIVYVNEYKWFFKYVNK